jgi:hypothetical protein
MLATLVKLQERMTANATGMNPDVNWLRLSSVLSHYEKKCGFPPDVLLPMGILKTPDFYFYIRRGYVLKDYGAGVKHGEFTHRLQWHIIMSVITADFTRHFNSAAGWSHTPLELYVKLGELTGIWDVLFDNQGFGTTEHELGRYPDKFHSWLLENGDRLGKLHGFLSRRETKRREEFVKNLLKYLAEQNIAVPNHYLSGQAKDPMLSHLNFRDFDAWVQKQLTIKFANKGEDRYKEVAAQPMPRYLERKTKSLPYLEGNAPKHRTTPYLLVAPTEPGPVYKLSSNPIWAPRMPTPGQRPAGRNGSK